MTIVRIALDVPLNTLFDYRAEGASPADIGSRVLVPFGRRRLIGILTELGVKAEVPETKLKQIYHVFRDGSALPPDILSLLQFCSAYYQHPLGEALLNALPVALRRPALGRPRKRFHITSEGKTVSPETLPRRAPLRRRLLGLLHSQQSLTEEELRTISSGAASVLKGFIASGWVSERQDELPTLAPAVPVHPSGAAPTLTEEQASAVAEITVSLDKGFQSLLLLGVTGSGKTEVYLQAMAPVLAEGNQVLILVPEINLTPQLEARFRARYPDALMASLHSGLSEGLRQSNWMSAKSGQAQIVLGTRLAVFTPMPRLRLIIVDEEHDGSFKQQDGLRYSARDVAVIRGQRAGVPVVLGSATPALETYHNAISGKYRLLTLSRRAMGESKLPVVRCIDTRRLLLSDGISAPLRDALQYRLEHGQQSLLFLNRRGYAPVLYCPECAWISACQRCAGTLVLHLREKRLRCHHCGHSERVSAACPACGNADLQPLGQGTQRIEDSLRQMFPEARILRIDRDSTRRKDAWNNMREQVEAREVDILVGTQMLAKGHDFPHVTLVGVLNADGALYSSDFRASERLFAQLMQVAGRAGRGVQPGEVLVQTQFPDHPLFGALIRHDYRVFAEELLAERQVAGFPPFVHQALLRAESPDPQAALTFLQLAAQKAATLAKPVTVYDPVPAALSRLAGKTRAQVLVQSGSRQALQIFLRDWSRALLADAARNVRWAIDVDPQEF